MIELAPGYLSEAYSIVRKAGGLCIADEVQTGFGRTGSHFWGFEAHGVVPDIVTLAKVYVASLVLISAYAFPVAINISGNLSGNFSSDLAFSHSIDACNK